MKYLLIVAGILAAIILVVVLIGFALPVAHQATTEATVKAPAKSVYALITDVDRYPTWRPSVKRIERLPDSAGKTRFREFGGDGTILYEVESAEPDRRIVTRIADRSLPFGGSWTYELTPRGDSTTLRITEDGEVYNPVFRFVSRFVMGHNRTMKKYLGDVQAHFGPAQPPGAGS